MNTIEIIFLSVLIPIILMLGIYHIIERINILGITGCTNCTECKLINYIFK